MLPTKITLPNGRSLSCNCQRPNCGLLQDPIKIDATDAEHMSLPNAFGNAVADSAFQEWLSTTTDKQKAQSVKDQFGTRLEAAREYIKDQLKGAQPRGIKVLEG